MNATITERVRVPKRNTDLHPNWGLDSPLWRDVNTRPLRPHRFDHTDIWTGRELDELAHTSSAAVAGADCVVVCAGAGVHTYTTNDRIHVTGEGHGAHILANDNTAAVIVVMYATREHHASTWRVTVEVGTSAHVDLVEIHTGSGGTVVRTLIECGDGAHVNHTVVCDTGDAAATVRHTRARVAGGTRYEHVAAGARVGWDLHNTDIEHVAAGAYSSAHTLCEPRAGGSTHHRVCAHHLVPDCTSEQHFVAAAGGHAHIDTAVIVAAGAEHSHSTQRTDTLLLDRAATVHTTPTLEVHCDDVVAAHGAAVGALDAEAVHYLRSRGLDEPAAEQLLIDAHTAKIRDLITRKTLHTYIANRGAS